MPRPVQVSTARYFREILKDYSTIFTLFYGQRTDSTFRTMIPIFEDYCETYSSPSVAFLVVKHADLPGLRSEYDLPYGLSCVCFRNERCVGIVEGVNFLGLDQMVDDNIGHSGSRRPAASERSTCRCDERIPTERTHRAHLHFARNLLDNILTRHTHPVSLTSVERRGHETIVRQAHLQYQGSDGRWREADVRVQQGRDGPELTYLDQNGDIAVERTIGRQ